MVNIYFKSLVVRQYRYRTRAELTWNSSWIEGRNKSRY